MPVEGILAGLLVEASTTAGSRVLQKYREKERGRRVSEELGDLKTEFNDALRERIIKRAGEDDIDSVNLPIVGSRWGEIADRVDG